MSEADVKLKRLFSVFTLSFDSDYSESLYN